MRTASCSAMSCVNSFGDEQLAVDLLADKLLFEALKFSVSRLLGVHVWLLWLALWPSHQVLRGMMDRTSRNPSGGGGAGIRCCQTL